MKTKGKKPQGSTSGVGKRIEEDDSTALEVGQVAGHERSLVNVGGRRDEHVGLGSGLAPHGHHPPERTRTPRNIGSDGAALAVSLQELIEPRLDPRIGLPSQAEEYLPRLLR